MKIKLMAIWLMMAAGQRLQAQYSADVINYINTYKGLAMTEMQRSGIPAAIILAQGIHESEAGTSELVKRSNNHFGIKCKDDWKGPAVYHDDDARGECFRSYATPAESYRDHSDFLRNSSRYAFLFKYDQDDYEDWAYGLKKAGYATNVHYPLILIKYIKDYNLNQYSLIAMGRMRPEEELVLQVPGPAAGNGVVPMENRGSATGGINTIAGVPGINPAAGATDGTAASGAATTLADSLSIVYPEGEFTINNTRVIFAKAGCSLLSVANQYELPLGRLLEFNDLKEEDVLAKDQLLFLARKRKTGATSYHIVRQGETFYDICQSEGLRYEELVKMNGELPPAGEKVWLRPKGNAN